LETLGARYPNVRRGGPAGRNSKKEKYKMKKQILSIFIAGVLTLLIFGAANASYILFD